MAVKAVAWAPVVQGDESASVVGALSSGSSSPRPNFNVSKLKTGSSAATSAVQGTNTMGTSPTHGNSAPKLKTVSSPIQVSLNNIMQQVKRRNSDEQESYWIKSVQADCVFAAAIVAHSLVIGFDVQMALIIGDNDNINDHLVLNSVMLAVKGTLNTIFTVELLLRGRAWGKSYLCSSNGFFDLFLVITGWTDILIVLSGVELIEQVGAMIYACRLLRLVRIFRLFAIVPALRLIVEGLASTTVASGWTVTLLLLLAYVGALLTTDLLAPEMPDLYGGVGQSIFTHVRLALVEAWPDIASPMMRSSGLWAFYLTAFMLICNMALLNVVTGLICEKVLQITSKQPPPTLEERLETVDNWRDSLDRVFTHFDADCDGQLSEAEYSQLLKTRDLQELLKDMGVGLPLDHYSVLNVLDKDVKGYLSCDELLDGLNRQRGTRSDHLSQTLQCDLAQRTHQLMVASVDFEEKAKAASREETRSMHKRLVSELRRPVNDIEDCELQNLEDASAELLQRVQGLKSTCLFSRDAAKARWPLVSLEDCSMQTPCDSPIKVKQAGTGSVGDHSSRSSSHSSIRAGFEGEGAGAAGHRGSSPDTPKGGRGRGGGSSSCSSGCIGGSSSSKSQCRLEMEVPDISHDSLEESGILCRSTEACCGSVDSPRFGSLGPLSGLSPSGAGMLHVVVLGLHGLRSSGEFMFTGSFDTYVTLRIGALECRTPTVVYNSGAAWAFGEPTLFSLELQHPAHALQLLTPTLPALEAEVMNAWLITDDSLGVATVNLEGLSMGRWHRRRKRLGGRQGGELELALRWEAPDEADVIDSWQGESLSSGSQSPEATAVWKAGTHAFQDLRLALSPPDAEQQSLQGIPSLTALVAV